MIDPDIAMLCNVKALKSQRFKRSVKVEMSSEESEDNIHDERTHNNGDRNKEKNYDRDKEIDENSPDSNRKPRRLPGLKQELLQPLEEDSDPEDQLDSLKKLNPFSNIEALEGLSVEARAKLDVLNTSESSLDEESSRWDHYSHEILIKQQEFSI